MNRNKKQKTFIRYIHIEARIFAFAYIVLQKQGIAESDAKKSISGNNLDFRNSLNILILDWTCFFLIPWCHVYIPY